MKKIFCAILVFLAFSFVAMAAPKKKFLNSSDADSTITLDQTTVAVIELWSNPSTGYSWTAEEPYGNTIEILGSEFESSEPGLIGAWGKEKIYVVGTAKGESELVMQYRRSWIKDNNDTDTIKFNFKTQTPFKESFSVPSNNTQIETTSPESGKSTNLGLPTAFNWCDQDGCTPVKNQGNCGSCWAFSTVGPMESVIKINDGIDVDLSEQYLVSCNSDGWGCNGGLWAHDYHLSKKVSNQSEAGAVLEATFPYEEADLSCGSDYDKSYQLASWEYVCGNAYCTPTTTELKQAIYEHGPVTVAVCANTAMSNYSGGVFTGPSCSSLNHGVVLVGWDDDDGCWIMRNSWGSAWGEDGYMRIQYGLSGIGAEACYVVYGGSLDPDPDSGTDTEPGDNEITNGQTISNIEASTGEWIYYYVNIPNNATNLQIKISGGSGDADLYTLLGSEPSTSAYDCRPYLNGNNETCSSTSPDSGKWYIGIHAYKGFSGVSLTATYDEDEESDDTHDGEITNGQTISDLSASKGEWIYYHINVADGATNLSFQISDGSGDADLYTLLGSEPSTSAYDCRPYLKGNNETCSDTSPDSGEWYIGIYAYEAFSGVSLTVTYH